MSEQNPEQAPGADSRQAAGGHRSPDGHHGDLGAALGLSHHHGGDHSQGRRRAGSGCVLLLVLVALMGGVAYVGLTKGVDWAREQFAEPADYPGPGTTPVLVEVAAGDTADQLGVKLREAGVVQSAEAYITYARSHADASSRIQVGYYEVKKKMSAAEAFAVLTDPDNISRQLVTVREGARVADIVREIVKRTDITRASVVAALKDPAGLGLPPAAAGNPEGYLFPATYTVSPRETAVSLLRQMVAKAVQVQQDLDLAAGARKVGLTPHELVTVASILEYEAKLDGDYPKVARAIYNRLDKGMALQSDATVSYASGVKGQVWTSAAERSNASPYNTYKHPGLPPGPIGSPGEATLDAALHPANGPWLYWVVVNLRTGETAFSTTYDDHLKAVAKFRTYCKTSDAC